MMRSLFSGVSGLKTHQTKMDVIGNNIANVNTTAYKTMSINFSDLMYQTTQAASGPNATTGQAGTNPRQIGLGVQTAAISTKITEEGATQSTGNPFDLKIAGDEFFIVSNGTETFFTRDGSFYVDAVGNLAMSSTGYNVMGWQTQKADDGTLIIKKETVSPLVIMNENNTTYPAEWTQAAVASGIVDWFDKDQGLNTGKTMNLQFFDNLGFSYTAKLSLHNAEKGNKTDPYTFYTRIDDILDANGDSILKEDSNIKFGTGVVEVELDGEVYGVNGAAVKTAELQTPYTDPDGNTVSTCAYAVYTEVTTNPDGSTKTTSTTVLLYPAGMAAGNITDADGNVINANVSLFNADGTVADEAMFEKMYGTSIKPNEIVAAEIDPKTGSMSVTKKQVQNGVVLTYSGHDGTLDNPEKVTLDLSSLGDAFTAIEIDFSKTVVSDNKGKSTVGLEKGNLNNGMTGRAIGVMTGVSIQQNGMIYASYSNNQTKLLGQIAVAGFPNPSGLQKDGNNLYSSTQNSGDFNGIGIDISENGDAMNTGVLEMSNVDLSSEFTEMITTQRGFQANSRIITVSDTLLEELVNLKR